MANTDTFFFLIDTFSLRFGYDKRPQFQIRIPLMQQIQSFSVQETSTRRKHETHPLKDIQLEPFNPTLPRTTTTTFEVSQHDRTSYFRTSTVPPPGSMWTRKVHSHEHHHQCRDNARRTSRLVPSPSPFRYILRSVFVLWDVRSLIFEYRSLPAAGWGLEGLSDFRLSHRDRRD